jgi:glyoxylase-like metal-dependent hydrolase (beta-lactamase superfamily II)
MAIIHTIDLKFQGLPKAIAVYLIPHNRGAVLVECGPGSTLPALKNGLESHGYSFETITDVFLTHIHLDHAGAAGWLARQGARIHVHPVGAPHLLNPEKLLASAQRIYGDLMEPLWGEFLAVPEEKLSILQDDAEIMVDGVCFRPLDTPGHASHHYVYILDRVCFSGDIGGVRMAAHKHLRLPMPPPEFQPDKWRTSLARLRREYERGAFSRIAPTHYGIYEDVDWHLDAIQEALDEVEAWMDEVMPAEPDIEDLRRLFIEWSNRVSADKGLDPNFLKTYEAANPSFMSADGIQRYWRKRQK